MWWAMQHRQLPITGTGDETRDFTYVEDIVAGTLLLGIVPEAVGDAFNLASETETKIKDIAAMVNKITGNDKGTTLIPRRDWDKITRRKASIEKARKVLGYGPETAMEDGIKKVYDWITENKARIESSARF
jgi:nucleoside-diphosphate-sugar epimerase